MNPNLWDDQTTASDSTDPESAQTTDAGEWETTSGADVSPLTAAIEASQWSHQDVQVLLQAAQVALLLAWVFHITNDD
ncbi:hypothetical protein [Halobacterium wangiae]|uniref:hypothetical protein n=1 Tax=Halobacterium wangiae TaxID=2902623 RepID=UPI001E4AB80F|nr:hypothetical protein [Halobacterium wangiae]